MRYLFGLLLLVQLPFAFAAKISVTTFNIWAVPLIFSDYRDERANQLCLELRKESKRPNGSDFILLQEAWVADVRERLKFCGYSEVVDFNEGDSDSGLMILGKYPLFQAGKQTFEHYPSFPSGESMISKGFVWAKARVPGAGVIWLFNLHLAENRPDYAEIRRKQLEEFRHKKNQLVADTPFIIGGDFNMGPGTVSPDPTWSTIGKFFPSTKNSVEATVPRGVYTFVPENSFVEKGIKASKLDHILASKHFNVIAGRVVFNEKFQLPDASEKILINLSDHYGWREDLEIATQNVIPPR